MSKTGAVDFNMKKPTTTAAGARASLAAARKARAGRADNAYTALDNADRIIVLLLVSALTAALAVAIAILTLD